MRNEEKNIVRKLNEMISMDYPSELVSLIVIDSASSDNTGQVGRDYLESMEPKLSWQMHRIEKPGKSLAVNFALNLIDSEIFIISDADSHCRSDTLSRLANSFSDPMIGAVCGIKVTSPESSDFPYRSRYNVIRLAESIRDSTPIFEGSIAAFRMDAIKDKRIDEDVNADDSQLALLSKLNGFRSIVNPQVEFWEDPISINRKRLVRRAQGLSRILFRHRKMCFGNGEFAKIMRMNLYFYLLFPWIISIFTPLAVFSGLIWRGASIVEYGYGASILLLSAVITTFLYFRSIRSLYIGASIIIESHLKLVFGNRLHIWDTNR